jgi:hypothetical protein
MQRTINSPGVEIFERDLSLIAPTNVGTNVFVTGFTPQGPSDEVIKITTRDELDSIYGTPTNSAERYFYYTVRELLNSPANIYTFRIPYGSGSGDGFGTQHTALVYPVVAVSNSGSQTTSVSSFDLSINYNGALKASPLSGSAFKIQTSRGQSKTVVFKIGSDNPYRQGDIVVPVVESFTISQVLTAIGNTLPLSATDLTVSLGTNTFTVELSGYVPLTITPSVSSSILAGLDDEGDVFTISSNTINSFQLGEIVNSTLNMSSGTYFLGKPYQVSLTEAEFAQAMEGTLFDWSSTAAATSSFEGTKFSAITSMGGAGIIIFDKAQTTINSQFEGYYVGIADNVNHNPASNFDAVTRAYTNSLTADVVSNYTQIPNGTLQFNLSATANGASNSISQVMENLTDYNIDGREDDDLLNIGVFKLRKSIYATEAFKLDYVLDDRIVGSIDSFRTQLNPSGGPSVPFFLETQDTNARNVEIMVNPYISNKFTQSSLDSSGNPIKKIRVLTESLLDTNFSEISAAVGVTQQALSDVSNILNTANALYPLGAYSPTKITQKLLGSIPSKINRALESVKNDEIYDIDVVVEGGLGTVFTMASAAGTNYYDDTLYNTALKTKVDSLRTSQDIFNDAVATDIRGSYSAVFNQFENFCNLPSNTGGRGDCIFIADPIRHILVTGRNSKILTDKTRNFQLDVYWAMRHQFELENTSYAATYGNWVQAYDDFTGEKVWIPFSGYQAAIMARSDAAEFPWSAPAGFTRGLVTNALDIAINPNQKQRDELYKVNINPVMFSASQGIVVFGQKTMSRKPSAFDRINVRRLFLALERPTKKTAQFFVFEPNNEFTRTRLVNTLDPIFKTAKENGGCYDYLIVCDERNNTPQVIDSNELKVDILIKPTRTGEFILCTFTATRSDANFDELV